MVSSRGGPIAFPEPMANQILLEISLLGDLTDVGRATTLHLGQRLRKLYVEQLKFLPENMGMESEYYLRYDPHGLNPIFYINPF